MTPKQRAALAVGGLVLVALGYVVSGATDTAPRYTAAEFAAVRNGQTLDQVAGEMGDEGEVQSEYTVGSTTTQTRQWINEDGTNAAVMFEDGLVVGKSQFGLD